MKKTTRGFAVLLCLLLLPISAFSQTSETAAPVRVINLVYDDSGSMYNNAGGMWSQALYAAEVLSGMLGETDTMNIYFMSDFSGQTSNVPRMTLEGSDGVAQNVEKIHNIEIVKAGETPFAPVVQAHDDFANIDADEKWLVILTDGEFNRFSNAAVDQYFDAKASDVRVYFISFGDNAATITENAEKQIFYEHARNGDELLDKMTDMCSHIFNYNKLSVDTKALHIGFDVPMYELTVFVQGQDVSVEGIIDASGNLIRGGNPVRVRYSTKPALNYPSAPYDSSLNGYIVKFESEFPAGDYTLSVKGADTVEVYYKPDVEIDLYLTDETGREVTSATLEAGEYFLNFCFVKRGTKTRLPQSELLGEITYTAEIVSNGVKHDRAYSQGEKVAFEEGVHRIDAEAVYLEYHTISTNLVFNIFENKPVFMEQDFAEQSTYRLTEFGFNRDEPIIVTAQLDGRPFTAEEWSLLSVPEITGGNALLDFIVEKKEPGIFAVTPVFHGSTREEAESLFGTHKLQVQTSLTREGDASWTGTCDLSVRIDSGYLDVRYSPVDVPTYTLDTNGIVNGDQPILVQATVDGRAITSEEWAAMNEMPKAISASGNIGEFRVEKTDIPGQYALYPTLYQDDIYKTGAVDSGIEFSYWERMGNEVWSGDGPGESGLRLSLTDNRTWLERNLRSLIGWLILAAILALILGYTPIFKKYLPKTLKQKPVIKSTLRRPGQKPAPSKGVFNKNLSSTLIPYKAETGTIRFAPRGIGGVPTLAVKANGGSSMLITNIKSYAGKKTIFFNGESIPKEATRKTISPGVLIEVKTDTVTYTCQPNV